jgi:hypothetical protein
MPQTLQPRSALHIGAMNYPTFARPGRTWGTRGEMKGQALGEGVKTRTLKTEGCGTPVISTISRVGHPPGESPRCRVKARRYTVKNERRRGIPHVRSG